jgi:F0F1-type ATP synthase membrane subunit b/b'
MSETSKTNMNEMMAGDGSSLALPPAFVFVNTKKKKTKFKSDKQEKIDGRKKGAKKLIQRVMSRRKTKMSEEIKEVIAEAVSDTEKAQKQIKASKEMRGKRDLQAKRSEAKKKMSDKQDEMNVLLRARMSDFKKKSAEKQQKADKQVQKNSYDPQGNVISEMDNMDWNRSPVTGAIPRGGSAGGVDVFTTAMKVAEEGSAYGRDPEISFANLIFQDGTAGRLGVFDAKRILATYEGLSAENRDKFRVMLNMSNTTYQKALDFAVRNIPNSY